MTGDLAGVLVAAGDALRLPRAQRIVGGNHHRLHCPRLDHRDSPRTNTHATTPLHQVAAYAEARGQRVIGYYQASERLEDCQLGAAKAVADTVRRNFPRACALVVSVSVCFGLVCCVVYVCCVWVKRVGG